MHDYEQHRRQEAEHRVLDLLRGRAADLSYSAFVMHWIEKKTIKRIAAELHVTERVVRRRVCKAKRVFVFLCEEDQEKDLLRDFSLNATSS